MVRVMSHGTHAYTIEAPSPEAWPDTQSIAGARALLVEDNELNQEVACAFLKDAGLQVDVADNGAIAVDKVLHNPYDIVLMDMQMPVMDGITATRQIRQYPALARLPIVAMTANAMSSDRQRCIDAGMNDYIAKPVDPQVLLSKLLQWIGKGTAPTARLPDQAQEPAPVTEQLPTLDTRLGLQLSMGKAALYDSLLRKFLNAQTDALSQMQNCLSEGRWDDARRTIHTLKGVAAQIGALKVRTLAQQLEEALERQAPEAERAPLQATLATELQALITQIHQHLPPDTAPEPPEPNGTFDRQAWRTLKQQLIEHLANDDATSVDLLETHRPLLQGALGPQYPRLAQAIESFDFAQALVELESLREEDGG